MASAGRPYPLTAAERQLLNALQREALGYFLDNQLPHGLMLDRQRNHGPRSFGGLCSTAATGMGLMALAVAAAPQYRLLSQNEARTRIRACLTTVLDCLPSDHGMMPHFLHARTLEPIGTDRISTIDSSWLAAGALWASAFLGGKALHALADQLYRRIDWRYWSTGQGERLLHGKGQDGNFLAHAWDRLNAETALLYVLAVGADPGVALGPGCWAALDPCYGCAAGRRFASADLGLFVFQYSMELLDLQHREMGGAIDLHEEARIATRANYETCRAAASRFKTYEHFWGLSAGDGPGDVPGQDVYRCYSPCETLDGTAHVTATLASVSVCPELVLENLVAAAHGEARGRYGYSNINVDRQWLSRDVVGIDLAPPCWRWTISCTKVEPGTFSSKSIAFVRDWSDCKPVVDPVRLHLHRAAVPRDRNVTSQKPWVGETVGHVSNVPEPSRHVGNVPHRVIGSL